MSSLKIQNQWRGWLGGLRVAVQEQRGTAAPTRSVVDTETQCMEDDIWTIVSSFVTVVKESFIKN